MQEVSDREATPVYAYPKESFRKWGTIIWQVKNDKPDRGGGMEVIDKETSC